MNKIVRSISASLVAAVFVLGLNFSGAAYAAPNTLTVTGGANAAQGTDVPAELTGTKGIITTIVNILLFVAGAVAVIMIIVGGIRYVTSNGDQAHVKAAKDTICTLSSDSLWRFSPMPSWAL